MDDGDPLVPIGELARRTGLTVKTIRFYSDRGIVPPAARNAAGHRLYGGAALARLELVRTLRDLGLDLATIRRIVHREVALADVAEAHARALTAQITTLRFRRAVATAVARRGITMDEGDLMHRLARLSAEQRRNLIADFLDGVFADLGEGGGLPGIRRTLTPELPDDPSDEQIEAWVELAELSQDEDFRTLLRTLAEHQSRIGPPLRRDPVSVAVEHAATALANGVAPTSPAAAPIVETITAYGGGHLPDLLAAAGDPRRQRYVELLSIVNGWTAPDDLAPMLDWSVQALNAHGGHASSAART
ncbi:helix-turn-helix domain-containing protein [Actinomadura hibisca]|uniref:helix-turn-helix domain-containing protein n=1 Tax=Actinomadura hibisca TaxID=68565 RepID=UPI00082E45D0|nr:MerR family transcriptional regulator [Actinomadura hibisca]